MKLILFTEGFFNTEIARYRKLSNEQRKLVEENVSGVIGEHSYELMGRYEGKLNQLETMREFGFKTTSAKITKGGMKLVKADKK